MTTGYDSVEEALKDAINGRENSMLRRVLRKHQGLQAVPAGADYISAMKATDGAVCLSLEVDDPSDTVIFRYNPDRDAYERYCDIQSKSGTENVGTVPTHAISRWVSRYGVDLLLHDDDGTDDDPQSLFENAAGDGGHPEVLPEP